MLFVAGCIRQLTNIFSFLNLQKRTFAFHPIIRCKDLIQVVIRGMLRRRDDGASCYDTTFVNASLSRGTCNVLPIMLVVKLECDKKSTREY